MRTALQKYFSPAIRLIPAAALFAVAVFLLPKRGPYQPPTAASSTIFDTSLQILRGFIRAGDLHLGFTSLQEMEGAWIDTAHGIPLYYAVEDSFANMDNLEKRGAKNNGLVYIDRIIYPVYGRDGKIRSAIEFDSTGTGLAPKEFDEGSVIRNFVSAAHRSPVSLHGLKIVDAPFLHGQFLMGSDTNGNESIMLRQNGYSQIRKFLPIVLGANGFYPIDEVIKALNKNEGGASHR